MGSIHPEVARALVDLVLHEIERCDLDVGMNHARGIRADVEPVPRDGVRVAADLVLAPGGPGLDRVERQTDVVEVVLGCREPQSTGHATTRKPRLESGDRLVRPNLGEREEGDALGTVRVGLAKLVREQRHVLGTSEAPERMKRFAVPKCGTQLIDLGLPDQSRKSLRRGLVAPVGEDRGDIEDNNILTWEANILTFYSQRALKQ